MRKLKVLTLSTAVLCLFIVYNSIAQKGMNIQNGKGWNKKSSYNKMYNTATVETISGEVVSVENINSQKGMSSGIHLTLKTEKETISVHLGPSWFLDKQIVKIIAKDKITVKGSRITFNGKPAMIAAEITKADKTLKLRDANGFPLWSGQNR